MSSIIYIAVLWYFWIAFTFFAEKNAFRLASAVLILTLIILFPVEWEWSTMEVKPVFLLLFCGGWALVSVMKSGRKVRIMVLAAALAFLFASLRLAEWYEPVVFLFGHTLTYVLAFSILFLFFGQSLQEKAALAVISCISGEIISQIHLYPWTQVVLLGDIFFMKVMVLILLVIHLHYCAGKAIDITRRRSVSFSLHLPR